MSRVLPLLCVLVTYVAAQNIIPYYDNGSNSRDISLSRSNPSPTNTYGPHSRIARQEATPSWGPFDLKTNNPETNEKSSWGAFDPINNPPTLTPTVFYPATNLPPTLSPTAQTDTTVVPTLSPTIGPDSTVVPTLSPTIGPDTTALPTLSPTIGPDSTVVPTLSPTIVPDTTVVPTLSPTIGPDNTVMPTLSPTIGTTLSTTLFPTMEPDTTAVPTLSPTTKPDTTFVPTLSPTIGTDTTLSPTTEPDTTFVPTLSPTIGPDTSLSPTSFPTMEPYTTLSPTLSPTIGTVTTLSPTLSPNKEPETTAVPNQSSTIGSETTFTLTPSILPSHSESPNNTVTQKPNLPNPVITTSLLDFDCHNGDGYYAIDDECDVYMDCRELVPRLMVCPDGLLFDRYKPYPYFPCSYPSEVEYCNVHRQDPRPGGLCPHLYGYFTVHGDCSQYIMCNEGRAITMLCPYGLVFNEKLSTCDWPVNVPQCNPAAFEGFECPMPGPHENEFNSVITKFRYLEECTTYIACERGYPRFLSCPGGLAFHVDQQACIHPSRVPGCEGPGDI